MYILIFYTTLAKNFSYRKIRQDNIINFTLIFMQTLSRIEFSRQILKNSQI
jgi:hypothetical protein